MDDRLHNWFGLSYASYLIIPRSILQSMPDDWKTRFTDLLEEADEIVDRQKCVWPPEGFTVHAILKDQKGRWAKDDLADYQRGRRRLWDNTELAITRS